MIKEYHVREFLSDDSVEAEEVAADTSAAALVCEVTDVTGALDSKTFPIKQHVYRVNAVNRSVMKAEVDYLCENGLAKQSFSPWSSPCLLMTKSDGSARFCTDYRKVNAVTVPDCFPLPRLEDCVDNLGSAKYVSKLDLLKGYWQVPLTPRASDISAFVTPDDFMQYCVMAFGMRNAPVTFQRLINILLTGVRNCNAYLDDLVIYSGNWSEHMSTLREVFERLANASLTLNLANRCPNFGAHLFLDLSMDSVGVNLIQTAALGRPFQLGMLYDCRKDELIAGIRFWNKEQLEQKICSRPQINTDFNVTASDSIEDKSKLLNIKGKLNLSVLGGLVQVSGAAKYLKDTKTSFIQQRLTLHYHSTCEFKELTVNQLPSANIPEDVHDTATHIVTGILYGADACFVFDRHVSSDEDKTTVKGEAKVALEKLMGISLDANADLNMNDNEKTAVKNFTCTFYGDFQLPSNPTTFEDAMKVFAGLPKLLKENKELAVPLSVWLYPLDKLHSRASTLHKEISMDLIQETESVLESLYTAEMKCSDLLEDSPAVAFAVFHDKILQMKQNCYKYKLRLMKKLGSLLPNICAEVINETALNAFLQEHEESPFSRCDLAEWLKERERESEIIKNLLKRLNLYGAEVEVNVDAILMDLEDGNLVSYTFTSLDCSDGLLFQQTTFLNPLKQGETDKKSFDYKNKSWLSSETQKTMRRNLEIFKNLIDSKDQPKPAKFIVSSKEMKNHPGSCILLYEHGCDDAVCFSPPSKPVCPVTEEVKSQSVVLKVDPPSCPATVELRLLYKPKQDTVWTSEPVLKDQHTVTLTDLREETEYEIKYAVMGKLNYTRESDVITVKTVRNKRSSEAMEKDQKKKIRLCQSADNNYQKVSRENTSSKTMRKDHSNGKGLNVAHNIKNNWSKKEKGGDNENLPMFKLNLDETWQSRDGFCRRCTFGKNITKENKTIMMIGATGAGKTTLINSMINYILGVQWEDDFRFVLIDEGKQKSQAESQTSEITAYKINHMDGFQITYSLTIVDTPGFGDTRGISQDQKITKQIQEFFSARRGIDCIDAVCFVVQASLARLTHTQRYIFDSILSIFGKDIAQNILVLVTFADGKTPPVLEAIKVSEVPCSTDESGELLHFKFNNSAVFATNNKSADDEEFGCENFDQMFWKLGFSSMKKFFTSLNMMKTQSLSLTQEVLKERQQLEVLVQGLQPQINAGLTKLDEIKRTRAALEQHKAEMDANKDFEYEIEVTVPKKIENTTGYYLTNCQKCHFTCHATCSRGNDSDKYKCTVMKDGKCKVCPGKCVWDVHHNQKYKWDYIKEKKKETYQELKKRFEDAHGQVMSNEKIFEELEKEFQVVQVIVAKLIKRSQKSLERLQEIALKPNPLSTPDYIDLMIESEKQEAKPGFQDRIKSLMEVRKNAEIISNISTGDVLPDEWNDYLKQGKNSCSIM
ncbi:hypothetical protein QQF64_025943 [Cirrhinus molitorella]|uniref:ribonuclease H n=1 Tax=Cirrhinus molitorella TaxID=172907 RepID=A0ABR3NQE4_9TELE